MRDISPQSRSTEERWAGVWATSLAAATTCRGREVDWWSLADGGLGLARREPKPATGFVGSKDVGKVPGGICPIENWLPAAGEG